MTENRFSIDSIFQSTTKHVADCLKQIERNQTKINKPDEDIKIDINNLIECAQNHPKQYAYYRGLYGIVKGAIKRCDRTIELIDGELYDYYRNEYSIKLSSNEIKYYITHDSKHRELVQFLGILDGLLCKLDAICEALQAKGYSINNITKLKALESEQARYER